MNEFGKVDFCSRDEVKQGFLLCENRTGIVLEKISQGLVEVITTYEGARINIEVFFEMCLKDARKYIGNKNTIIHVDLNPWKETTNHV